jgi:hypothetical protein
MHTKTKFSLLIFLIFFTCQALASLVIPRASILIEEDNEDTRTCQFSYKSAEAAAKSALRYNRIEIQDSISPDALVIYIGSASFIEFGRRDACAVVLKVEFYQLEKVKLPVSGKEILSKVVHCANGSAGTLLKKDVQQDLNAMIRNVIELCISEIEKKTRR